jgi:hypothetical protein
MEQNKFHCTTCSRRPIIEQEYRLCIHCGVQLCGLCVKSGTKCIHCLHKELNNQVAEQKVALEELTKYNEDLKEQINDLKKKLMER